MTDQEKFLKVVIQYMENNNNTIKEILKTIEIQNVAINTMARFQEKPQPQPKSFWTKLFG